MRLLRCPGARGIVDGARLGHGRGAVEQGLQGREALRGKYGNNAVWLERQAWRVILHIQATQTCCMAKPLSHITGETDRGPRLPHFCPQQRYDPPAKPQLTSAWVLTSPRKCSSSFRMVRFSCRSVCSAASIRSRCTHSAVGSQGQAGRRDPHISRW